MSRHGGKYEAQKTYDKFNTTQVKLKLNDRTDADILRWLYCQKHAADSSMQGAIKKLIRKEIAQSQTRQLTSEWHEHSPKGEVCPQLTPLRN